MDSALSERLLKTYKLRSTQNRLTILHLFQKMDYALSHSDIENVIDENLDRVTIYRTIKTFLQKGIIHKVLDDRGSLKYALCTKDCSTKGHHHDHIHFKCSRCGQTNCLDIDVPKVTLPKAYRIQEVNFLIQGICYLCSNDQRHLY
jgi:Fur family ferric uptake transcriptional regulator